MHRALIALAAIALPIDPALACSDASFFAEQVVIDEMTPPVGERLPTDTTLIIGALRSSLAGASLAAVLVVEVRAGDVVLPGRLETLRTTHVRWHPDAPLPAEAVIDVRLLINDIEVSTAQYETLAGPSQDDPLARVATATADLCTAAAIDAYGDCLGEETGCGCDAGYEILSYRPEERLGVRFEEAIYPLYTRGLTVRIAYGADEAAARAAEAEEQTMSSGREVLAAREASRCAAVRVFDAADTLLGEVVRCAEHRGYCTPATEERLVGGGDAPEGEDAEGGDGDCSASPIEGTPIAPVLLLGAGLAVLLRRRR